MKNLSFIGFFLLSLILQIGLFNRFFFAGYLNPYAYVGFVLLLPLSIKRSALLLWGFLLGFSIDVFENSGGVHTAASVLIAYLRPLLVNLVSSRLDSDRQDLSWSKFPLLALMAYALIGLFIHHFALFTIEQFSWGDFGMLLVRSTSSSLFSFSILLLVLIWFKQKRNSAL